MGLAIGQTPAQLSAARTLSAPQDGTASPRNADAGARNPGAGAGGRAALPGETDGVRAGFGSNTISPAAAALVTLDSNLERAREIVPTVEELRAQLREAQARATEEFRSTQAEAQLAAATQPPESLGFGGEEASTIGVDLVPAAEEATLPEPTQFRPEAAPQVRAFAATEQEVIPPPAPEAVVVPQNVPGLPPAPQTRLDLLA